MQARFGLPLVLVIIDTVPRAAGYTKPGDENDAAMAKVAMAALSKAAVETGTFFLGAAHFGKAVDTGTRGSSSFEDDSDVVIAMLGEKNINGAVANTRLEKTVRNRLQKNSVGRSGIRERASLYKPLLL
jgi:hypothetical protein